MFLRLGLTSFGGPVAHLGYFRTELVERRRWLPDGEYADLVALCQFLPGPASSQVGFLLGLRRAGLRGALAAWAGFTAPSAAIMVAVTAGVSWVSGPLGAGVLTGLKVVAVAVVAQAVLGMARTLTPDPRRASIAAAAACAALLAPGTWGQLGALAFGAIAGMLLCRSVARDAVGAAHTSVRPGVGVACLLACAVLLVGGPLLAAASQNDTVALADAFSRTGALVFGGGHVVLPLLQAEVVQTGWVSEQAFLAGYGAAQAVPGPLFTFAAYLGALSSVGPGGLAGALVALVAIFLPGLLLAVGVLPFWDALRARPAASAAVHGANAAVVGVLAAALYSPVFTTGVTSAWSFCLALVCFVMLVAGRTPPWAVVLLGCVVGALASLGGA